MIELIGLDKSFGSQRILTAASLSVRGGESVALVGANGSGKTTTLRCAVGLARVNGGGIHIDGVNLAERPCEARARLSYLAQRTDFPGTLTVREILSIVKDLRSASSASVDREISLCGLTRLAGRTVAHLSGGERQRVAMAVLFIPEAAAYLLDEPTMNLDPAGTRVLIDRLAALRDQGRAILFTTHLTAELDKLATRVVALRNGCISPVTSARSEGALAAALEALKHEGNSDEFETAECGDRGVGTGRLWRRLSWAGAGSAGSR